MSKVFIEESTLSAIGDSIRAKTGKKGLIGPLDMSAEIKNIPSGTIIKTVEGTSPITLEDCSEGTLLDYKIYGAEGGVGRPSKNLIRWKVYDPSNSRISSLSTLKSVIENGYTIIWSFSNDSNTGALSYNQSNTFMMVLEVKPNTEYTLFGYTKNNIWEYNADLSPIQSAGSNLNKTSRTFTTSENTKYIIAYVYNQAQTVTQQPYTLDEIYGFQQLEFGAKATTYEPFGTKIIVRINDNEYQIVNLDSDTGLNAEDYIDFENRIIVKDGITTYLDLPAISLPEGTNTFDINTILKPSNILLTYVKSVEFNIMKTVEGQVPLNVDGARQRVENYKIYGAEGGVGDKTKNLCSGIFNTMTKLDEPIPAGTVISFSAGTKGYDASSSNTKLRVRFLDSANTSIWNFYPTLDESGNRIKTNKLTLTQDVYGYWLTNTDVGDYQIEVGSVATEYEPYGMYRIGVKVNDNTSKILIKEPLEVNDYIDFENRVIVKNGVATYLDLPEIYLQNWNSIIDIDTTMKPSKISVSYIDSGNKYKHIHGTGEVKILDSMCNQVLENVKFSNISGEYVYTWNQLNDLSALKTPFTTNGITAIADPVNGSVTFNGTATSRALFPLCDRDIMNGWDKSHKYYLKPLGDVANSKKIQWHTYNTTTNGGIYTGSQMAFGSQYPRINIPSGAVLDNLVIYPQIFDLTMMFGDGNEPTVEQFEAMFQADRYGYDSGTSYSKFSIIIDGKAQEFMYQSALPEYTPEVPVIIPKGNSKIALSATIDADYYTST